MDEERKNEEREKPKSLHKDGRVWGLIAVAAVAGFLIAMVFYGKPWHLPPAWGDVPTWLLAAGAAVTAWLALLQLRDLRDWIARNAERDSKRDDLLDKQLEEAERRARSERRQLVEGVEVTFTGTTAYVDNNSKRPINDLTCRIMSKVDRVSLASAAECGEAIGSGLGRTFIDGTKPVSRFETLRPGATCGFTFGDLTESPDQVLVAWFTDDDEFRWQLDQYQHLVDSGDESVYLPIKTPQPLPQRAPAAIGGTAASASAAPPATAPQPPDPAGSPAPQGTVVTRPGARPWKPGPGALATTAGLEPPIQASGWLVC